MRNISKNLMQNLGLVFKNISDIPWLWKRTILGLMILGGIIFYVISKFSETNKKELRIAIYPSMNSAALIVAHYKDYFFENGIKLQIIKSTSPTRHISVRKGEFDLAVVPIVSSLFSDALNNPGYKIIADVAQASPIVVVTKNDSSIKTVQNLKGKRIRVLHDRSLSYFQLAYILDSVGIDIRKDVNLIYLNDSSAIRELSNNTIDCAVLVEPYATLAVMYGYAYKIVVPMVRQESVVLIASETLINSRSDVLKEFLRAYKKGIKIYREGINKFRNSRSEVREYMSLELGISEAVIDSCDWPYIDSTGVPSIKSIEEIFKFWKDNNFITNNVDIKRFIDTTLLQ